ncbi:PREDICTED: transcription factor GTE1-like isoform X2 [Nicotiana attenuata]|uniref:Transcription factor gte6 n=1 Tax=Nicotiana attenuata TaxID=49451 RepID=A0A1J6I308_NICAT|nr:PREDICTED: transcription factor GTE1-like isoform X2 [Nicotiana attenuata]OIS98899.1 transcription factor gte6 [Nicotiana attenuata]
MENANGSVPDIPIQELKEKENADSVENFSQRVDEMVGKVDQLEQRLNDVEHFYSNTSKKQSNTPRGSSILKDKDKQVSSFKRRQQDASRREAAGARRMQELVRQFGTILRQITQHKWAEPFMEPVDVEGLGLHDYFEVIEKPMDFSTIKRKMEAKDGSGYKHVREICADVRLIFKNAMKYNEERHDVHVMAKTLLGKFEEKWLQLLPKVDEEEKRRKEEEAEVQQDMQLAQEAAHAKMAKDLSIELDEVDMQLEELREMVLQKCRKMSTEDKKKLGNGLTRLSPEDLNKALLIVAQSDPTFQATATEVELDMNAQSESTLWKLKFFVQDVLHPHGKSPASIVPNNINNNNLLNNNNKRRREICDALAKSSQKRSKKPS